MPLPLSLAPRGPHAQLRLSSLAWALVASTGAGTLGFLAGPLLGGALGSSLESALRSAGCGFFYGLLAFHLQRVDPEDTHLQAGLVGAVCGIRSLASPLLPAGPIASPPAQEGLPLLMHHLPGVVMDLLRAWLPLWLPLVGSAVLLQGAQRLLPALRPWTSAVGATPGQTPAGPADRGPAGGDDGADAWVAADRVAPDRQRSAVARSPTPAAPRAGMTERP